MSKKRLPKKELTKRPLHAALMRCLTPDEMDALAKTMLTMAKRGNFAALKETWDRVDGRVPYKMGGDEDGAPIELVITGVPRDGDE